MDDITDRFGSHFVMLIDSRVTMKEFEFDQVLLMPTAAGYRALVEEADIEIKPKIKNYLSQKWSEGAIENLSFFAMAAAVYARSISDPPYTIDIGKVLLRTVAFCNLRCAHRKETGGGCQMAMSEWKHSLPKCIKLPRDVAATWLCVKKYIATNQAASIHEAMSIKADIGHNFSPSTSC
jgi:hypothetical protein